MSVNWNTPTWDATSAYKTQYDEGSTYIGQNASSSGIDSGTTAQFEKDYVDFGKGGDGVNAGDGSKVTADVEAGLQKNAQNPDSPEYKFWSNMASILGVSTTSGQGGESYWQDASGSGSGGGWDATSAFKNQFEDGQTYISKNGSESGLSHKQLKNLEKYMTDFGQGGTNPDGTTTNAGDGSKLTSYIESELGATNPGSKQYSFYAGLASQLGIQNTNQ